MRTHTPSPLVRSVATVTDSFHSIDRHVCVCRESDGGLVAVTGPAGDLQSEADADLFAAAPDMLALLASLNVMLTGNPQAVIHGNSAAHLAIRAAISKALGQA